MIHDDRHQQQQGGALRAGQCTHPIEPDDCDLGVVCVCTDRG
jgi:hypothetical protein